MVDIESGADKQRRASSSALNDLRDAKVTVEDSSFKSSSPTKGMRSPFVLLLFATHEYCVCQQLPMTFRYPDIGVSITTTYVVILKTKLPVFNYLYAVLDQFESIFNGLDFVEPLEVQELDMPVPAELRLISELGYKLKKVITPIYPYMLDDKSIRRLESEEVLEGIFPTGSYQASQLTALFPEIEFFMSKNQKKIDIIFNRNTYIPFYSSYNSAKSVSSKAIKDLMTNYYSRRPNGLFPDAIQKFEREREDSFMILMWALPTLLKYLPLDQIVLAIGCALSEMKCILVKHKDFQVISSAVFALVHLLRPLHWCGNVVVILPDSLLDLIGEILFVNCQHIFYY